ncbi:MAG: protein translocase subunit SecF [Candidatus Moranbacteria bacterium]|nr:protein translocase subunit SecF [Candidatus Moranbacteria bacterium]
MIAIIQKRKYFYILSLTLFGMSMIALSLWGLRLGIDFQGGTLMEIRFSENIEKQKLEEALSGLELQSISLQQGENNSFLVRYLSSDEVKNEQVRIALIGIHESAEIIRTDFFGSSVSKELTEKAIEAVIVASIVIALYIAWAFRKLSRPIPSWQYGLGALIALLHDVIITLGIFSLLGNFFTIEIGIPFIAAILTVLGYSVNDTIVVYDRIRENLLRHSGKEDFESIINRSVLETIGRSINTSMTVVVVLLAIILFGGTTIFAFSLALLIGIIIGTYSSIFVASALLVTSSLISYRKRNS